MYKQVNKRTVLDHSFLPPRRFIPGNGSGYGKEKADSTIFRLLVSF